MTKNKEQEITSTPVLPQTLKPQPIHAHKAHNLNPDRPRFPDLHNAKLPLSVQQPSLVLDQLLELGGDDSTLFLDSSIERDRLCIRSQPRLQVPVRPYA